MKEYKMLGCVLDDGRRISYRLKKRPPKDTWNVCFVGPLGECERSTKEANVKKAEIAAATIIKNEYNPKPAEPEVITWDYAIMCLKATLYLVGARPNTLANYLTAINLLRQTFPDSVGPADIGDKEVSQFLYDYRIVMGRKASTLRLRLIQYDTIWNKWWIKHCKILPKGCSPWGEVETPKVDKPQPRRLLTTEQQQFFDWMKERWKERLPILFLEVLASLGCRGGELAALETVNLRDGRVIFPASLAKGRKERRIKLPPELYAEVVGIAGKVYVWEKWALRERTKSNQTLACTTYKPHLLAKWMRIQLDKFREAHPEIPYFKLHNFRGKTMTEAKESGVHWDDAATTFGCNPATMRKHYDATDEQAVADEVMERLFASRKPQPPPSPSAGCG